MKIPTGKNDRVWLGSENYSKSIYAVGNYELSVLGIEHIRLLMIQRVILYTFATQ